ncbi:MAG TPA: hypothetical protein VEJ86_05450 [Candidatus Binataceae bacterium]|nr:hypothetical protein [Candidatus Binataceae bacterium]
MTEGTAIKLGFSGFIGASVLVCALACATNAHAIALTLSGEDGSGVTASSQALWASDSSGVSVLITEVGLPAPSGESFTEVGVPSMMPDGRVLFGAESRGKDGKTHWEIYYGNPDAPPVNRVRAAFELKHGGACDPLLSGDPYPIADSNGMIAFMSHTADKRDSLVTYANGVASCLARAGDKTNQGSRIAVLAFGSPQMGANGELVFDAWLADPNPAVSEHRQALLIASAKRGITELAVEGNAGPNNTRYERPFGLPSAIASPDGTMVAFTSRTPSGAALFLYRNGSMTRLLPTGVVTTIGPVSFLSPGRPGLMTDGTTAVLAGCARIPAIFKLAQQLGHEHSPSALLDLSMERGQLTPFGSELESLGDPIMTASGAMFVGATDTEGRERLYVLDGYGAFFEVGGQVIYRIAYGAHEHSIFTGTLSVNQHGDFTYLGGK